MSVEESNSAHVGERCRHENDQVSNFRPDPDRVGTVKVALISVFSRGDTPETDRGQRIRSNDGQAQPWLEDRVENPMRCRQPDGEEYRRGKAVGAVEPYLVTQDSECGFEGWMGDIEEFYFRGESLFNDVV